MRLALPLLPVLLVGCILQQETCGVGFVEADGVCVVSAEPAGGDARTRDAFVSGRDAELPRADASPRWAGFDTVLVIDRSSLQAARANRSFPGVDLDSVEVFGPQQSGFGVSIVEATVNDPFGVSACTDPNGALGASDSFGLDDPERVLCLGSEGGFVAVLLDLERPLRSGDELDVFEVDEDLADDVYETFLCREADIDPAACVSLGEASGLTTYLVP